MPDKFHTVPATKELFEEQKAKAIAAIQSCQFENRDEFVCVFNFQNLDDIITMNAASQRFVRAAGTNLYNSTT